MPIIPSALQNYTDYTQFRLLRVLNEDVIGPGKGFGPHPEFYLHFGNIDDEISAIYT
jgi:hypothetical protein